MCKQYLSIYYKFKLQYKKLYYNVYTEYLYPHESSYTNNNSYL